MLIVLNITKMGAYGEEDEAEYGGVGLGEGDGSGSAVGSGGEQMHRDLLVVRQRVTVARRSPAAQRHRWTMPEQDVTRNKGVTSME